MGRSKFTPRPVGEAHGVPFERTEDAWRWAHAGRCAQLDGARFAAGLADTPRPCEPMDILRVVQRLHRNGRLGRDHLTALVRCGRDDPGHPASIEQRRRQTRLWQEAMDRLAEPLRAKGILASKEENKT